MPSQHRLDEPQRFDRKRLSQESSRRKSGDGAAPHEVYLADERLEEAVNLAVALGRPLLVQGEPGCGKTRLAYAVAYALGLGRVKEAYVKSTSRAQDLLYTYDAVGRLFDAQLGEKGPQDKQGRFKAENIENYIKLGPLGQAIREAHEEKRRAVVLIDEIDKADLDFPNDLLWELDRLEFEIPEVQGMRYKVPENRPDLRPIIFITHNEEKALPAAFLRRCIFHWVEFPKGEAHLMDILALHEAGTESVRQKAIEALVKLREIDLSKKPGLAELIDWVRYMDVVKTPEEKLQELPYLGVLLKQEIDRQRVLKRQAEERERAERQAEEQRQVAAAAASGEAPAL